MTIQDVTATAIIEQFKEQCPKEIWRLHDYSIPNIMSCLSGNTLSPVTIGYELWFRLSGDGKWRIYREVSKITALIDGEI